MDQIYLRLQNFWSKLWFYSSHPYLTLTLLAIFRLWDQNRIMHVWKRFFDFSTVMLYWIREYLGLEIKLGISIEIHQCILMKWRILGPLITLESPKTIAKRLKSLSSIGLSCLLCHDSNIMVTARPRRAWDHYLHYKFGD